MRNFIARDEFISSHKTDEKHFTRDRVWDFSTAFFFICNMLNKRAQTEIDSFLSRLYDIPEEMRQVSASAFTQCRDKMRFTAFSGANSGLVRHFYGNYDYQKYYGLRLVAVDGSVYTLPKTKALVEEFGDNVLSENGKWVKAQVSFAADVLNNTCIDAQIGPYIQAEGEQALSHLHKLGDGNLYLLTVAISVGPS